MAPARSWSWMAVQCSFERGLDSVWLDARELHDLGPLQGVFGDELAEIGNRSPQPRKAKVGKPRFHLVIGKSRVDLAVELVDDLGRRVLGRGKAQPGARLETRQEFAQGCHFGQRLLPLRGRNGEGVQLAGSNVLHRPTQGAEEHIHLSAKQVSYRWSVATIGNVQHVDPGRHLE